MTQGPNAPSPNTFSFEIFPFFFFFERFGNLDFFFLNIYMNKVHQMLHGFLEFKET